jgi:hypothetical protein
MTIEERYYLGYPRKSFITFDEIEIPTKFPPNLVEVSTFLNFNFDVEIEFSISLWISKSEI